MKKLDKTDLDFQVLSSGTSLQNVSNTYHAEATIYKLESWAQEWLKLIYDRESSQLNLDKLGEQTASMLKEETIQRANWFDLFDQFID